MAKIQNISKFTQLWALQNLIFWKNTAKVLMRVSLAGFTQCSRLNAWQKPQACRNSVWAQEHFQPFGKDCPHDPESLHRILRQTAGGTSERQHTLSDVLRNHDRPVLPITNYKIVSAIRNEMASRLDIEFLQEVLASHWKPYLENLHVCMSDATCYESHMRFPTDMKLLWESIEWLHRHICQHCGSLA